MAKIADGMLAAITPMLAETCIFSNSGRWAERRFVDVLELAHESLSRDVGQDDSSSSPPYRTSMSVERMRRRMMETMSRSRSVTG